MKKLVSVLIAVIMLFSLSGCAPIEALIDSLFADELVAQMQSIQRIGFCKDGHIESGDDLENIVEATEFGEDNAQFSYLRSDYHFNQLNDNEKLVYRALEYAMENQYLGIYVDGRLLENSENLCRILEFLSLDSPLLEQNLNVSYLDFSIPVITNILNLYTREFEFSGYAIAVNNFENTIWEKKMEAVDVARTIVDELDDTLNEQETAEELYSYLAQSVEYNSMDVTIEDNIHNYLYDALITKETNCDGYTNALSLLYNLANIECFEKKYYPIGDDETAIGHTWNTFQIVDKWYNVDATWGSEKTGIESNVFFGYPDILQPYEPTYREIYPESTDFLGMEIDAHLASVSEDGIVEKIATAYRKNNRKWSLVVVDSFNEKTIDRRMQSVANRLNTTVYYNFYSIVDGRTMILVFGK